MKLHIVAAVLLVSLLCPKESISAPTPVDDVTEKVDHDEPEKVSSITEEVKKQLEDLLHKLILLLKQIKETASADEQTDLKLVEAKIEKLEQSIHSLIEKLKQSVHSMDKDAAKDLYGQLQQIWEQSLQIESELEKLKKTISGDEKTDWGSMKKELEKFKQLLESWGRKKRSPFLGSVLGLLGQGGRKKRSPMADPLLGAVPVAGPILDQLLGGLGRKKRSPVDDVVPEKVSSITEEVKKQLEDLVRQMITSFNEIKKTASAYEQTDLKLVGAEIEKLEQSVLSLGKDGAEKVAGQVKQMFGLIMQIESNLEKLEETISDDKKTDWESIKEKLEELKKLIPSWLRKKRSPLLHSVLGGLLGQGGRKKRSPVLLDLSGLPGGLVQTGGLPLVVGGGLGDLPLVDGGLVEAAVGSVADLTSSLLRSVGGVTSGVTGSVGRVPLGGVLSVPL